MLDFERLTARIFAECHSDDDISATPVYYNVDNRLKSSVNRLVSCLMTMQSAAELLQLLSECFEGEE